MTSKSVPAAINETAFDCPHCGAYTTQFWYALNAKQLDENRPTPLIPTEDATKETLSRSIFTAEQRENVLRWFKKMDSRIVWMNPDGKDSATAHGRPVLNLHVSRCYACGKFSVWVHSRLVDPAARPAVQPNADLPDDIATDFNEAASIVNASPRAAAALLRLCVQKLCIHLGGRGNKIDDDIAVLVANGLLPRVQQSLDIVRVIGNEAVHPGTIDLRDDPTTAFLLFGLVNAIADQMISQPKAVEQLYAKLPQAKREAIEERDGKNADVGDRLQAVERPRTQ